MKLLVRLLRFGAGVVAAGVAWLAMLAFFGFAVPALDVLNHLQVLLFAGTLFALLTVPLFFPAGRGRTLMAAWVAVGFVASAGAIFPEAFAALQPHPEAPTDGRPVLTLMTHNLFGVNDRMDVVDEVILAEDPDILAFQEYFDGQASALHPLIRERYPYSVRCEGGKRANIGLYAKIPFDRAVDGACSADEANGGRTAHIIGRFTLEDGTSFSVMTTHLDWPAPRIARQKQQFAELTEAVRQIPGPLILVGDFNSTPWSHTLRGFLAETGFAHQTHNLLTYPMRLFLLGEWRDALPFLPLDHVLTKGGIFVHELHAAARTFSDHRPVVFEFSVAPEAERPTQ